MPMCLSSSPKPRADLSKMPFGDVISQLELLFERDLFIEEIRRCLLRAFSLDFFLIREFFRLANSFLHLGRKSAVAAGAAATRNPFYFLPIFPSARIVERSLRDVPEIEFLERVGLSLTAVT